MYVVHAQFGLPNAQESIREHSTFVYILLCKVFLCDSLFQNLLHCTVLHCFLLQLARAGRGELINGCSLLHGKVILRLQQLITTRIYLQFDYLKIYLFEENMHKLQEQHRSHGTLQKIDTILLLSLSPLHDSLCAPCMICFRPCALHDIRLSLCPLHDMLSSLYPLNVMLSSLYPLHDMQARLLIPPSCFGFSPLLSAPPPPPLLAN